jgi:hypothetical protein
VVSTARRANPAAAASGRPLAELSEIYTTTFAKRRAEISGPPFDVIGHDGHGPGGPGFGSGTTLDGLEPGPVLVAELDDTWDAGLARLSDDELAGVALAWRRCESRAAAGLLVKAAGAPATLAQLRAAVFLGLLTGHDPLGFLPEPDQDGPGSDPEEPTSEAGHQAPEGGQPAPEPRQPAPESERPATGPQPTTPERESPMSRPDAGAGPLIRRGSVHLTMPLAAWLGLTQSPGDISGFGPASAETCREIADLIAQNPGSRWCLTLTDANGHAVGHGCARRPPPARENQPPAGPDEPPDETDGPPGGTPRPPGRTPGPPGGTARGLDAITGWLAGLRTGPVQAGSCSHAREVPGYRIPESLHHIVKTRQRTCSAPYCNRPAEYCDDDHTLPYDQGGRTCECDLAPLCRRDHQAKQAQGWRLLQPSPGVLVWELPTAGATSLRPASTPPEDAVAATRLLVTRW